MLVSVLIQDCVIMNFTNCRIGFISFSDLQVLSLFVFCGVICCAVIFVAMCSCAEPETPEVSRRSRRVKPSSVVVVKHRASMRKTPAVFSGTSLINQEDTHGHQQRNTKMSTTELSNFERRLSRPRGSQAGRLLPEIPVDDQIKPTESQHVSQRRRSSLPQPGQQVRRPSPKRPQIPKQNYEKIDSTPAERHQDNYTNLLVDAHLYEQPSLIRTGLHEQHDYDALPSPSLSSSG